MRRLNLISENAEGQSQQITGSGLGTEVPGPLLSLRCGTREPKCKTSEQESDGYAQRIPKSTANEGEIMAHELKSTIALLERTPVALNGLLRGLPESWTERNEGQGTWSVRTVIAHLIHAEDEDWLPRARMIFEFGETRAFVPFGRDGYLRYKRGKTLAQLLDEFARTRARGLKELRVLKLSAADLKRRGRHPAFGAVTLSQLLATWAAHDLTHLHQISRIMAYQYRKSVGPWVRFLGVMQCAGHSTAG